MDCCSTLFSTKSFLYAFASLSLCLGSYDHAHDQEMVHVAPHAHDIIT